MIKNIKYSGELTVYLLISICVIALILGASPTLYAQQTTGAQILISPERVDIPLGENFTITVNLTNAEKLYTWQVVLKYNGTVINCTDVWIPADNVFSGHLTAKVSPLFDKDYEDGLDFMMYSCSLFGDVSVNVVNGILFKANFTVINAGATTIDVVIKEKPAKRNQYTSFWSYWVDYDMNQYPLSSEKPCIVTIEGAAFNLRPSAIFIVQVPEIDTSEYVVLRGYPPIGLPYTFAYKDVPLIFNASSSKDYDGNITLYVWDFGDGNVTETIDPIIVHVYHSTGRHDVVLTVFDDGDPPLNSTYTFVVVVGLLLKRFDWSPFLYGLAGVFLVGVVVYSVRKVRFKGKTKRG